MSAARPVTTLFLLVSADGKISTGATDAFDVDRDFPRVAGLKEGLPQYYDIERTTDLWALNTGRVLQKTGVNEKTAPTPPSPVSFVVVDNAPHLNRRGLEYLCAWLKRVVLVTTDKNHPAFSMPGGNLDVLYQRELDLKSLLETLYSRYGVERLTVQAGGQLNGRLLREKLLDRVDLVVAPVLVGGKDTPTPVDGAALATPDALDGLGVLQLEQCDVLKHSYLRLRYRVVR